MLSALIEKLTYKTKPNNKQFIKIKGESNMSTENSKNNQYVFKYKDEPLSEVITYRKYVVKKIQEHEKSKSKSDIQTFSCESVSDERFSRFIRIAKDAGYTIYKVMKL